LRQEYPWSFAVDVIAIDALEFDHLAKLLRPVGVGGKPLSRNDNRLVPRGGAANAVVAQVDFVLACFSQRHRISRVPRSNRFPSKRPPQLERARLQIVVRVNFFGLALALGFGAVSVLLAGRGLCLEQRRGRAAADCADERAASKASTAKSAPARKEIPCKAQLLRCRDCGQNSSWPHGSSAFDCGYLRYAGWHKCTLQPVFLVDPEPEHRRIVVVSPLARFDEHARVYLLLEFSEFDLVFSSMSTSCGVTLADLQP